MADHTYFSNLIWQIAALAAMRASKQEASKQLRRLVTEGHRTATVVRAASRDHYGPTEERVAEHLRSFDEL